MDPISVVVTALATGATLGLKDTTTTAVQDAYLSLRKHVRQLLVSRPDGELVLSRHEVVPAAWEGPLAAELQAAGADADPDLLQAAQALLGLADAAGYQSGKYRVDARGSSGVQAGDHNVQHNTFGRPAAGDAQGPGR